MKRLFVLLILSAILSNCNNKKLRTTKYEFLKKVSIEANKHCPIQVDSILKLQSTLALPVSTFRYNYTLKYDTVKYDIHEFKKALRLTSLNSVKTHPDAKMFRDMNATIEYYYSDTLGNYLFKIVINPGDYNQRSINKYEDEIK